MADFDIETDWERANRNHDEVLKLRKIIWVAYAELAESRIGVAYAVLKNAVRDFK